VDERDAHPVDQLEVFRLRQRRLRDMLRRLRDVGVQLQDEVAVLIELLGERVAQESFKVPIVGVLDAGKTTLVNAFLQEDVLPARLTPSTGAPCEIKYVKKGEEHALLHPRDGSGSRLTDIDHLRQHLGFAEDDYAFILVELFWPLDLCRNGVEIVDTPGYDSHKTLDEVTTEYVGRADAIIYLSRENALFRGSDLDLVRHIIMTIGQADNAFYVINWAGEPDQSSRELAIARVQTEVAKVAGGQRPESRRIFIINAKAALDGALAGDAEAIQKSGLPEFEGALRNFLTEERGRVKIQAPAQLLREHLKVLRDGIENQRRMYNQDLGVLADRYAAEEPKLRALESQRKSIIEKLGQRISRFESVVAAAVVEFFSSLAQNCPDLAVKTPIKPISMISRLPKGVTAEQELDEVVRIVHDFLIKQCENAELDWQLDVFRPELVSWLRDLESDFRQSFEAFLTQVHEVEQSISNSLTGNEETLAGVDQVMYRSQGLHAPLVFNATEASISQQALQLAKLSTAVRATLVIPHPAWLLTALPTWGIASFMQRKGNDDIKRQIGEGFRIGLEQTLQRRAADYTNALALRQLVTEWDDLLGARVKTVRNQVDSAMRDMKEGEQKVAKKAVEFRKLSHEIDTIERACSELLEEIDHDGLAVQTDPDPAD